MRSIRNLTWLLVAGALALGGGAALAQEKKLTPQQQRMSDCAHENKGKKGDEYKAAMKECLKSKAAPAATTAGTAKAADAKAAEAKAADAKKAADTKVADAKKTETAAATSQKDKMKACNAQAKEQKLKGDDRKKFMSTCLKG